MSWLQYLIGDSLSICRMSYGASPVHQSLQKAQSAVDCFSWYDHIISCTLSRKSCFIDSWYYVILVLSGYTHMRAHVQQCCAKSTVINNLTWSVSVDQRNCLHHARVLVGNMKQKQEIEWYHKNGSIRIRYNIYCLTAFTITIYTLQCWLGKWTHLVTWMDYANLV